MRPNRLQWAGNKGHAPTMSYLLITSGPYKSADNCTKDTITTFVRRKYVITCMEHGTSSLDCRREEFGEDVQMDKMRAEMLQLCT